MSQTGDASPLNPYQSPASPARLVAPTSHEPALPVTPAALDSLRGTRPWVRMASTAGTLMAAAFALFGVVMSTRIARGGRIEAVIVLVIYFLIALTMLVPALLSKRYADSISELIRMRRSRDFERAVEAQRRIWAALGWIVLIVVGLYALLIAFAVLAVVLAAM